MFAGDERRRRICDTGRFYWGPLGILSELLGDCLGVVGGCFGGHGYRAVLLGSFWSCWEVVGGGVWGLLCVVFGTRPQPTHPHPFLLLRGVFVRLFGGFVGGTVFAGDERRRQICDTGRSYWGPLNGSPINPTLRRSPDLKISNS